MRRARLWILAVMATMALAACAGEGGPDPKAGTPWEEMLPESAFSLDSAASYSGKPYTEVNGNIPYFSKEGLTDRSYEYYSELDALGRCGAAYASIGQDLMPTEERESIGQIKPSGWHTAKYNTVDGKYLYNRCHLIGFQLSGENANEKNLITGTRYMNTEGMLPFENMVADYVKETKNHVLYRVTPVFEGDNLVASGVLMEAESVEDKGGDIQFCVYVYNVQPGIVIDYATGESRVGDAGQLAAEPGAPAGSRQQEASYILNANTHKFHDPSCESVAQMKKENRQEYTGSRDSLISQGYAPCKSCNP